MNLHLAPNPYQALGLVGRYRHGPSRWCATGDPAAEPQDLAALPDEQEVRRAPPEPGSAHRTPMSFPRSGTVISRGPSIGWHRPTRCSVCRLAPTPAGLPSTGTRTAGRPGRPCDGYCGDRVNVRSPGL